MPIFHQGRKVKEVWHQGRKVREIWHNGQKVFSGVRLPRQATIKGKSVLFSSAQWDITSIEGDKSIFSQVSPDMIELAVPVRMVDGIPVYGEYEGRTVRYAVGSIVPAGAALPGINNTFTFREVI